MYLFKINKLAAILLFILLIPFVVQAEESPNYCLDPEANSQWIKMLSDNPGDDVIAKLFALRVGLCELVKREIVTLERATMIFEAERSISIQKKKDDTVIEGLGTISG